MTIPSDPADQAANEAIARNQLNLDSSQPVTTIQIRLADGSNVRVQFNLTHTIEDVRRFITTYPLQSKKNSHNVYFIINDITLRI